MASSSVLVPDLANAARAMRSISCLSACSNTTRGLTGQDATALFTFASRCGTVGTTTSIGPTRCCTRPSVSPKMPASRSTSPLRLPGIAITIGGSARRRIASAPFGRSFATSSISGWPT